MIPGARFLIPMKPLSDSKTRLRAALPDDRRRLLSLAMLVHVLQTVSLAGRGQVFVLGGDDTVRQACNRLKCSFVPDSSPDLNRCLATSFEAARAAGVETAVFLPADLPLLSREDIQALVDAVPGQRAVIAPDRHNAGTNGLVICGTAPLDPSMGPGSFQRHLIQLALAGTGYEIRRTLGLGFDVDTPDDLDLLLRAAPDWWERAEGLGRGLDWRGGGAP
jgi:2-phospho-L-lactate guanylyltransferase